MLSFIFTFLESSFTVFFNSSASPSTLASLSPTRVLRSSQTERIFSLLASRVICCPAYSRPLETISNNTSETGVVPWCYEWIGIPYGLSWIG